MEKRRNSTILLFILYITAILIFLGTTPVQAGKKATFDIPRERKKIIIPSEEPIKEDDKAERLKAPGEEETGAADYLYDPTNKVDPFKSFVVVQKELEEKEKPKTYLETLDLSQVSLSAIVLGDQANWALVRDSKGDGHVIKVGTSIGRNGGHVIKILEKEVVVREYHRDIRGREKIPRDISIKLPSVD